MIEDVLALQDNEANKNSFYRAPVVTPTITHNGDHLTVKTVDAELNIGDLEETLLYIVATFKFVPIWLAQQWYAAFNRNDEVYDLLASMMATGVCWIESTAMGIFLRPTKLLLDMYKPAQTHYVQIPFGLLNHTCCEEQFVFDVMSGNVQSEFWQILESEELLPKYHPLNLTTNSRGTVIIHEGDFKANRFKPKELLMQDEDLRREIASGERYTSEFSDFSKFPIVYQENDGTIITQTPDLIIPVPRKDMQPCSYALELELSAKTPQKYKKIMLHYKNNIKFGKLYYLCGSTRIMTLVKNAFDEVGGLGTCKLFIVPVIPPAQSLEAFSKEDNIKQSKLLRLSINLAKG